MTQRVSTFYGDLARVLYSYVTIPVHIWRNDMRIRETFWIDEDVLEKLKKLSEVTRVTRSIYIREGIDMVLERYRTELKKPKTEGERRAGRPQ